MAVTAKFLADFSSFNSAVSKAELKLTEFRTESSRVEGALKRMGDSFSGKKILSDASLAAKAVQDLGGVSKLTAGEQSRLNGIVTEAIAKYRALGQNAPQSLLDIEKATTKVKTPMNDVLGLVGKIGPALIGAFSVGSITTFTKSIGSFAGKMVDLQAQTKISTDRLQAFNFVGAGVGLTIDDIVTSADQLAKRIGGGDKSAIEALEKLNIAAHEFTRLSLDDAMLLIDERMAGVSNQFERASIQADLFGRSGARMGRMMDGTLRQMIEQAEQSGAVIDEELIKKADAFDDAWAQAWLKFKAGAVSAIGAAVSAIGKLGAMIPKARTDLENFDDVIKQAQTLPLPGAPGLPQLPSLGGGVSPPTEAEIKRLTAATTKVASLGPSLLASAAAMREFGFAASSAFSTAVPASIESLNEGLPVLASWNEIVEKQPLDLKKWENALYALPPAIKSTGVELEAAMKKLGKMDSFLSGLKGLLGGLTGGNGLSGFFSKMGTGIAEGFGNIISGGLTSLINGGINLLGKGIGKLFGGLFGGGEGKKVNDLRDAAFNAAGGFDLLNQRAAMAGTTLERVLSAKKIKDWEKAWAELQGVLEEAEADQQRLNAAIEKYGFSIEELGPKLQKQELDKQAKELIEDWRVLADAGINISVINEKMADTVQQYLNTALRVGAEIPAAMRPILQSMIDQGELVDENGEKITDLEKSGIKFSETMTQGFDRVVKKLDELIDRLAGAGAAISRIPKSVDVDVNYRQHTSGNIPDSLDAPGFASGTRGRYLDFGAGTAAILHGKERVVTQSEGMAEASAAWSAVQALASEFAAFRGDFNSRLPKMIASAVMLTGRA